MQLYVDNTEINSIDSYNGLVQQVLNLGKFSKEYTNSILDDMVYKLDTEDYQKESYEIDGRPIGLFQNTVEGNGFLRFTPANPPAIPNALTQLVIHNPNGENDKIYNLDVNLTENYYNNNFKVLLFILDDGIELSNEYKNKFINVTGSILNGGNLTLSIGDTTPFAGNELGSNVFFKLTPFNEAYKFENLSGASQRSLKYHRSKPNRVRIPLSLTNLMPDYDKILLGFKWSLKFHLANANTCLFHNSTTKNFTYRIIPQSSKLYLAKPILNERIKMQMSTMYRNNKVNIDYNGYNIFNKTQTTNGGSIQLQTFRNTEKPLSMFVCFHNQENVIGNLKYENQNYNSLIFDNANLEEIHLRIESTNFPSTPIRCNFVEPTLINSEVVHYNEAWQNFLSAYGMSEMTDQGSSITKEEFRKLYPIFYFDIESSNSHSVFHNNLDQNISVIYKLKDVIKHSIYVVTILQRGVEMNLNEGVAVIKKLF
jgi:hypothetical protein